jgi:hypothetical protein
MMGKKQRFGACAFGAGFLSVLLSTAVGAATITVNSLADPGASGICALRDAITAANAKTATNGCVAGTGNDTIQFSVTGTIPLAGDLPTVTDSHLTINGPASPGITISGGFFSVEIASGATVSLKKLRIVDSSGGIDNSGTLTVINSTVSDHLEQGGISNGGTLTVINSTVSDNFSFNAGGGIFNVGTLTVINSTISRNGASEEPAGGIYNDGTLTVINSTFYGNGGDFGGGITNTGTAAVTNSTFYDNIDGISSGGRLTVTNSTFSGNIGVGIAAGTKATIKSTILAANSYANCFGTITDTGYNISDDTTCGFAKTGLANNGDGVNPLLSPAGLANNGGPTQTIALQSGSPAIDAIPVADCTDQSTPPKPITTDQRGFPRPESGEQVCDIGAYEFQDFAGQPGKANCHGKSVSALAQQFGSINAAASALHFRSVQALHAAIRAFCGG